MKSIQILPIKSPKTTIENIASDKSISHRAAIFSLLSDEKSIIKNYLQAEDTLNTLKIVQSLGARIQTNKNSIEIYPPKSIKEPPCILDCGNSGTAMRILIGFLASQDGFFVLHGDKYLATRPMRRVIDPLIKIGAKIDARDNKNLSPISVRGEKLKAFSYDLKIASAQVKTALILAALNSDGNCFLSEPELSRDHTEKMLLAMGANIRKNNQNLEISPLDSPLLPLHIDIPKDPSSAFFFALLAAIIPDSKILLKNVLLNQTRIEAFKVLQKMGTNIKFTTKPDKYDEVGDILVEYRELKAVEVSENISWLIDELPALSIAFACAKGTSVVRNAKELRVKESDRIKAVVTNLQKCQIKVNEFEDGYEVIGGELKPALVDSFGDHRIAMSFIIAGLKCQMQVQDIECINTSFPNFFEILSQIGAKFDEY